MKLRLDPGSSWEGLPEGWVLVLVMKMQILVGLFTHFAIHW